MGASILNFLVYLHPIRHQAGPSSTRGYLFIVDPAHAIYIFLSSLSLRRLSPNPNGIWTGSTPPQLVIYMGLLCGSSQFFPPLNGPGCG